MLRRVFKTFNHEWIRLRSLIIKAVCSDLMRLTCAECDSKLLLLAFSCAAPLIRVIVISTS